MNKLSLFIKERGKGKTTALVYTSGVTGFPIVVPTKKMAEYTELMSRKLGVEIPHVLTVDELKNIKSCGVFIQSVLVDNAEFIIGDALDCYLGVHVAGATLSDERKPCF